MSDSAAAELVATADAWDLILPWMPELWDLGLLRRFKNSGFTFVSLTLQDWPPTWEGTLDNIRRFKELAEAEASWLIVGTSVAELERGRAEGKLVVGFNSQETRILGHDLSRVETLHAAGVRHMLLAYNLRNLVADGCAEVADAGLSNFGRQLIAEMNRVGIIVDCSHTGRRSSLEAIELSERTPIFSHSGAYAVCAHIRNISDEQMRACAARGGVIGIVGVGAFLGDTKARTETMFRHLDHAVTLVGPEHVGLGLDYLDNMPVTVDPDAPVAAEDGEEWPPRSIGWPDPTGTQLVVDDCSFFAPEQLTALVETMLAHGYQPGAVRGILGGNFKRVYEEWDS